MATGFTKAILARGMSLASRTRLVFLVTALTLLAEPILPNRSWFVPSLEWSLWDSLRSGIAAEPYLVPGVTGLATILNIGFACWFTQSAFKVHHAAATADRPPYAVFALRFSAALVPLLVICVAAGALLLLVASALFVVSPLAEKVVALTIAVLAAPAFAVVYSFLLYWSYLTKSLAELLAAALRSLKIHGRAAYGIFALTVGFRLLGLVGWYAALSAPVATPLRLLAASLIMSSVIMFIRGVRFEFLYVRETQPPT